MKCEDIVADGIPSIGLHTAAVHNDFLYIFGGELLEKDRKNLLWRFDISNI